MLNLKDTQLLVVDIQECFRAAIHDMASLLVNAEKMIRGAGILELPIVVMEQNPSKLGHTVVELQEALGGIAGIPKMTFSGWAEPAIVEAIEAHKRKQVLVLGIEAHVCVYQTCMEMLAADYEVVLLTDAISARLAANVTLAKQAMQAAGVRLSSVEMALFELMQTAEHPHFRDIQKLIK